MAINPTTEAGKAIISSFNSILLRSPDENTYANYLSDVSSGKLSIDGVQQSLLVSAEKQIFVEPVVRLYQASLGRVPEEAGLKFWVDAYRSGVSLDAMAFNFTQSTEFKSLYGDVTDRTALVTALYSNVLGRDPDAGGLSFWVNSKTPVDKLLVGFAQSAEFIARANAPINALLEGRADGIVTTLKGLFDGDKTSPTVAIVFDKMEIAAGATSEVKFVFSEPVKGFDLSDLTVAGGTLSKPVQSLSSFDVYTATFTAAAATDKASINFTGAFADASGNPGIKPLPVEIKITGTVTSAPINGTDDVNTLNGTEKADQINGLGGNDTLNGLGGNDTLDGGTGADTMTGGSGDDIYYVDNLGDVVVEEENGGTDEVRTTLTKVPGTPGPFGGGGDQPYVLPDNVENLTFIGKGNFLGSGNSLDNVITGGDGDDTLDGVSGKDTINGGKGNDTIVVQNINSTSTITVDGGEGSDTIKFSASGGFTVDLVKGTIKYTDFNGDGGTRDFGTLKNVENVTGSSDDLVVIGDAANNKIIGSGGYDKLYGGDGDDTIDGSFGNDIIDGGSGINTLTLGTGNDTVLFTKASGTQKITDFVSGEDKIDLTGTGVASVSGLTITAFGSAGKSIKFASGGTASTEIQTTGDVKATDFIFDKATTPTNSAPTGITLTGGSVAENSAKGTVVGTAMGLDPDKGDVLSYALTTQNSPFTIDSKTGVISVADGAKLDYETKSSYGISIKVSDNGSPSLSVTKDFTIKITDVVEPTPGSGDIKTSDSNYVLGATDKNLTFTGTGSFLGKGNALDNVITGGDGNDILMGQGGNDTLIGRGGFDVLIGGSGNDTFDGGSGKTWITTGAGNDTILVKKTSGFLHIFDFGDGKDKIDVSNLGVTSANFASKVKLNVYDTGTQVVFNDVKGPDIWIQGIKPGDISAADFILA